MSRSDKPFLAQQRNPSSGSLQNGVAFGLFVSESRFGDGGNRNQLILAGLYSWHCCCFFCLDLPPQKKAGERLGLTTDFFLKPSMGYYKVVSTCIGPTKRNRTVLPGGFGYTPDI